EEEVKVAWEILKALKLRERGPVLIACPTCGRLQFDMDSVVAEIEQRLETYEQPIEVAVLGCAVNGIGEASHADFGITGAKNEGLIFAGGKPLRKVPTERLVDELFVEIDKSLDLGRTEVDENKSAEGAEWLAKIEEENADDLTPERLAALEAANADGTNSSPGSTWRRSALRSYSVSTSTTSLKVELLRRQADRQQPVVEQRARRHSHGETGHPLPIAEQELRLQDRELLAYRLAHL